jgi:hypothetical protein
MGKTNYQDAGAQLAAEIMQGRNERVLRTYLVLRLLPHHKKEKAILLLAESAVHLYRAKGLPRSIKQAFYASWFCVKRLDHDPPILTITTDSESASIEAQNVTDIYRDIFGHLFTILSEAELPPNSFPDPLLAPGRPICRFRALVLRDCPRVPNEFEAAFKDFIESRSSDLDLSQFPRGKVFGPAANSVIDALIFLPIVTSLTLPATDDPHWAAVGRLVRQNPHIRTITTSETADDSFTGLVDGLDPRSEIGLLEIRFLCPELKPRHIRAIGQLYRALPIRSLTICSGLLPESRAEFFRALKGVDTLRRLTLNKILDFSAGDFLTTFEKLQRLTITNSNLEIGAFLALVERRGLAAKFLDLSGNVALRPIETLLMFPVSLEEFVASDVEFREEPFSALFRGFLMHRRPISVTLSRTGLKPDDIDSCFRTFSAKCPAPKGGYPITEFVWDDNPVTSQVIRVLEKCDGLKVLSVNGVDEGRLLGEFLSRNKSVIEFRMAGTAKCRLSKRSLLAVFDSLSRGNRTVAMIDISNNRLDKEVVDALVQLLLDNRALGEVAWTDCEFEDLEGLSQSCRRLLARGMPLTLSNPGGGQDMTDLLLRLSYGDSTVAIPKWTIELAAARAQADVDVKGETETLDTPNTPSAEPDPNEWVCTIDPIPEPDNDEVLRRFRSHYTVAALVAQLKSESISNGCGSGCASRRRTLTRAPQSPCSRPIARPVRPSKTNKVLLRHWGFCLKCWPSSHQRPNNFPKGFSARLLTLLSGRVGTPAVNCLCGFPGRGIVIDLREE